MKPKSPTDILADQFLEKASTLQANIEPLKVLRARTYRIAQSNTLIRAASFDGSRRRYFFGLNYLHVEEMANLDNPFIAFICGSVENSIIIPAAVLFGLLSQISHDRNGEYKIHINLDNQLVLKGRNNRYDCRPFVNAWNLLLKPDTVQGARSDVEDSLHSVLQGRLLEIGNIRGFRTYSANKSKRFNGRPLAEISTLDKCPSLQFSDYETLRQIDVLWFREKGPNLLPANAFEIEISTGTWSGVGRMATLADYRDVLMYVVSNDARKYVQVMNAFFELRDRYKHVLIDDIGELYSAELQLKDMRSKVGL